MKWGSQLNLFKNYHFYDLLIDQDTLKRIIFTTKMQKDELSKICHSLLNNIEKHCLYLQSNQETLQILHIEIIRAFIEHAERVHIDELLQKFSNVLNEIYLFNYLNINSCEKVIRKANKQTNVNLQNILYYFTRKSNHIDYQKWLYLYNSYYQHIVRTRQDSQIMSKALVAKIKDTNLTMQMEGTIIIPTHYLLEFMTELAKSTQLQKLHQCVPLGTLLELEDQSISTSSLHFHNILAWDSTTSSIFHFKTGEIVEDIPVYEEMREVFYLTFDTIETEDKAIEIVYTLKCNTEVTDLVTLYNKCFCKIQMPSFKFDWSIINLHGKINEDTYNLVKKWINKKYSTYQFNSFHMDTILTSIHGLDIKKELKLYPKIHNYVENWIKYKNQVHDFNKDKQYSMGIENQDNSENYEKPDTAFELEQLQINRTNKSSVLSQLMGAIFGNKIGEEEYKSHFANERTFLQQFGAAFSIQTFGFTLGNISPEFESLSAAQSIAASFIVLYALIVQIGRQIQLQSQGKEFNNFLSYDLVSPFLITLVTFILVGQVISEVRFYKSQDQGYKIGFESNQQYEMFKFDFLNINDMECLNRNDQIQFNVLSNAQFQQFTQQGEIIKEYQFGDNQFDKFGNQNDSDIILLGSSKKNSLNLQYKSTNTMYKLPYTDNVKALIIESIQENTINFKIISEISQTNQNKLVDKKQHLKKITLSISDKTTESPQSSTSDKTPEKPADDSSKAGADGTQSKPADDSSKAGTDGTQSKPADDSSKAGADGTQSKPADDSSKAGTDGTQSKPADDSSKAGADGTQSKPADDSSKAGADKTPAKPADDASKAGTDGKKKENFIINKSVNKLLAPSINNIFKDNNTLYVENDDYINFISDDQDSIDNSTNIFDHFPKEPNYPSDKDFKISINQEVNLNQIIDDDIIQIDSMVKRGNKLQLWDMKNAALYTLNDEDEQDYIDKVHIPGVENQVKAISIVESGKGDKKIEQLQMGRFYPFVIYKKNLK